jgi:DNA excision repair protein ERCC-6
VIACFACSSAWRLGQRREVVIYRLITSGTIEEKVYQRQIFKHLLTKRILVDPRQSQSFSTRDLRDLFTLSEGRFCCCCVCVAA